VTQCSLPLKSSKAAQGRLARTTINSQGTVYRLTRRNAPIDFVERVATADSPFDERVPGRSVLHRAAVSACGRTTADASWAIHYELPVSIIAGPGGWPFFVKTRTGWQFWGYWCGAGKTRLLQVAALRGHSRTLAHTAVVPLRTKPSTPTGAVLLQGEIVRGVSPRPRGAAMPTVFGYHDVKDTEHWLASPKREEFLGPLGVTNIRTFVDPEKPTRVGVLMDVADMDAMLAAMETEEAAEAMAFDGVLPETLVILVER
jgi:hypothetical protein